MLPSRMARRICLWLPALTVIALSACGGAESGFFSDVDRGGASQGGASHGGASSHAAGSPSNSGGSGNAANSSNAGNVGVAGGVGAAGDGSAGEEEAGRSGGGASSAGASSGGRGGVSGASGAAGRGGAGGSGAAAGHGGAQAGSGGKSDEPTCDDLFAQANQQLEAAQACSLSASSLQCIDTVKTICNCEVPVRRSDSAETKAYLATLRKIDTKNCKTVCTAQACKLVTDAECRASGSGSTGVCTAVNNGPGHGSF